MTGTAEPTAQIQLHKNGVPLGPPVQADTQGQWHVQDLPMLTEADQVTSTQLVNAISSVTSTPIVVGPAVLTQIALAPAPTLTVERGTTHHFTATGTFSNGRVEAPLAAVTWSSATPTVATIDEDGTATGIHAGTTTIQATRAGITSGSATLTVQPLPPVLLSTLKGGDTSVAGTAEPTAQIQLHKNGVPLGPPVQADTQGQWHVQDLPMLTEADQVTSTQLVNAISSVTSTPIVVGPAVLTQIALAPAPTLTVERGTTHHFTATGTFSNGRVEAPLAAVTWSSATPTVATIDEDGTATGIHAGTTTIQATRAGITSGSATLTVQPLPPVVASSLKAGDIIIAGSADPSANIQLHKNGVPLGPLVQADAQGQWQVQDLPMLTEADQVTSTQTINSVQSAPSTVVQVLPNHPPVFDSLSDQKVQLGKTLRLNLSATDPDGDALTFLAAPQPLPANSEWDTATGLFTFTPSGDQVGAIPPLTFQVSDGYSVQGKSVKIEVVLPKDVIILLGNSDGSVGMINVTSAGETLVLDQSGQAVTVGSSEEPPNEPFMIKEKDIRDIFQEALEATPEKPLKFILYFNTNTTELSPESQQQLPEIIKIITGRTAPDIGIIGHTDRTASDKYNHQLSMRRATTIRDTIVTGGIDSHLLEVTGHGENNPLVETADDVSEPLNRRVEIIVR